MCVSAAVLVRIHENMSRLRRPDSLLCHAARPKGKLCTGVMTSTQREKEMSEEGIAAPSEQTSEVQFLEVSKEDITEVFLVTCRSSDLKVPSGESAEARLKRKRKEKRLEALARKKWRASRYSSVC